MLTNTGITIYNRNYSKAFGHDEWEKIYIPKAWWFKEEKSTLTAEGRINADVYTIRIPGTDAVIKKDDYIVRGNCNIKMETVKDLENVEKVRVTSVNYNTFGDNPHIKVVGV